MNNGFMVLLTHSSGTDPLALTLVVMPYENELEVLQKCVGGYIESLSRDTYFPFSSVNVIGWCNDEGKLIGLPPTLPVVSQGRIIDYVVGDILVQQENSPDTLPLSVDDVLAFIEDVSIWYWVRFGIRLDVSFQNCDMEVIEAYERAYY